MRIGVDLDGVIYNSENWFMAMAEFYDIQKNGNGIVDSSTNDVQKRYGLSDEEALQFRKKQNPMQILTSPLMPLVKEALSYLKEQGHQIIIITSRGKIFNEHIKLTTKKLKKDKIIFDELYFSKSSKLSLCQEKNIDVMIDDSFQIVDELAKNNIKCIQFKADQTKQAEHQNVKIAYNWGEVIRFFQN